MSRDDIRRFFDEYVFGFIFGDIRREIELARSGKTAGNLLAALGLLCYTEVMGGIERGTLAPGNGRQNFETFFKWLGPDYESFLETEDAYEMLRCGMAHEYLVKGVAQISMVKANGTPGVAVDKYDTYHFNVERYFEDFERACRELYDKLMRRGDPTLPPELEGRSP